MDQTQKKCWEDGQISYPFNGKVSSNNRLQDWIMVTMETTMGPQRGRQMHVRNIVITKTVSSKTIYGLKHNLA